MRLKEARISKKLSRARLAELLGVGMNTIYRWEVGQRTPSEEDLQRIAKTLGCTVAYLRGIVDFPDIEMIEHSEHNVPIFIVRLNDNTIAKMNPSQYSKYIELKKDYNAAEAAHIVLYDTFKYDEALTPSGMIKIPIMDSSIIACAGAGNGWIEEVAAQAEEYIYLSKETVGPIGVNSPFAVKVEGDSMEAAGINNGAIVTINPEAEIYDGDVVLVAFGIMRQVAVKWIYFRRDGSIELRSANSAYQPLIFSKEDIEQDMVRVLGKVVCVVNKPKRGI